MEYSVKKEEELKAAAQEADAAYRKYRKGRLEAPGRAARDAIAAKIVGAGKPAPKPKAKAKKAE